MINQNLILITPNRFLRLGDTRLVFDNIIRMIAPPPLCEHELDEMVKREKSANPLGKVRQFHMHPQDLSIYNKNFFAKSAGACGNAKCILNANYQNALNNTATVTPNFPHILTGITNLSGVCSICNQQVTIASTLLTNCPVRLASECGTKAPVPIPPKCECGATKCGYNLHSDWCPVK